MLKRLIITVLVLAGVLVAADYAAAAAAESVVSRQLRERLDLADDPNVRINGFPFLTQAVAGEYGSIELTADRLKVGDLQNVQLRANLHDVQAPLSGLLGSGTPGLRVGTAEGAARVGADDINRMLPGIDRLSLGNVDANAIADLITDGADPSLRALDPESVARISGDVPVGGGRTESVVVFAELQVADGAMRVVPRVVRDSSGDELPEPVASIVRQTFALRVDPGGLPFGVVPTTLQVRDGTLEIAGEASDVVIGAAPGTVVG
ncbi:MULTISPECIES: DUF2993 domain-containing protein [Pseudonocardia]|uniref:DUF2993 domain-containing protein n=1 Tax=Pseudonocardia oroxyli TaxID=366584 RepID=A0A1G7UGW8_PSEOR|nr:MULTISPECIES: DUF2993 domain-containing protein [Pseudonocardia]MCF7551570.1 DUF2993 domain-containing protein [Pseudonocardia sp. WMMC193]SDG46795.1 Protein of unknown function [Pseudonocardia oroxyli]